MKIELTKKDIETIESALSYMERSLSQTHISIALSHPELAAHTWEAITIAQDTQRNLQQAIEGGSHDND